MVMIAGETLTSIDIGLFVIFLLVLALPFKVKIVEKNLEAFLFIMGSAAVTLTSKWGYELVKLAAEEPVMKGIVPAVLVAGLIFFYGKTPMNNAIRSLTKSVPMPLFVASVVFILGMASSLITAIIAALLLVEITNLMPMERKDKINLVIIVMLCHWSRSSANPLG